MKEKTFENKQVHIQQFATGNKRISIHMFNLEELKVAAKLLELELSRHNNIFWVTLPATRNKIKVTLFANGRE